MTGDSSRPASAGAAGSSEDASAAMLHGHMPALDGVRGLAILMVLALHFVGDATATSSFEAIVADICVFGKFGVDLFFVLSGFLITGILIDAKGSRGYFRNFYVRRVLRIFPLYYGVLAFAFLIAPLIPALRGPDLAVMQRDQAWAWLYLVNVLVAIQGAFSLPYIDHFWSLAVEEHFYLFWPLIVALSSRRALVRTSLAMAIVSLTARVVLASRMSALSLYVLTPFRLDALCLGGFFAAFARGPNGMTALRRALWPMSGTAAAVLLGTFVFNRVSSTLATPLHELRSGAFTLLLAAVMLTPLTSPAGSFSGRFFGARVMRFFGKYSYGLYVFHHFLSYYFVHHGTEFALARRIGSHALAVAAQAAVGVVASLAVSIVSYNAFERPFIALKRFWPAGRADASAPVTQPDAAEHRGTAAQ